MLGDFITRGLVLVLGYAYPAFECFKTVEKNRVEIEELLFWCQYWIIVAVLTVFERIGDIFISWLPLYGEVKLALFIYLWYPKTKGTRYVYETFLRPYVAKHETDIDRSLKEMKARAWDLAIYYWQNCTQKGQTTFVQMIQYLVSQSTKIKNTNTSFEKNGNRQSGAAPTPLSPKAAEPALPRTPNKHKAPSTRRRPPIPPPSPTAANRAIAQSPKSEAVQVHLHSQTEFIHVEDDSSPESVSGTGSTDESDTSMDHSLQEARLRLRRSKGFH